MHNAPHIKYNFISEQCLLISFPGPISENTLQHIIGLDSQIQNLKLTGIVEIVTAYTSIAVFFDPSRLAPITLSSEIEKLKIESGSTFFSKNSWEIPVCYDTSFGIDLEEVAKAKAISTEEVVRLHSRKTYTVYMLGFLPGFIYLGTLYPQLELPRRKNPRIQVAQGSVAIGGNQTGMYGINSPGGWNIIGRTSVALLDLGRKDINPLHQGDEVTFVPVSLHEYESLLKTPHHGLRKV